MKTNYVRPTSLLLKVPFFLIVLFFVIVSCSDDKKQDEVVEIILPAPAKDVAYDQLVKAESNSLIIDEIVVKDSKTTLIFADNSSIDLLQRHNVYNLDEIEKIVVEKGADDSWLIDGKDTKIYPYSDIYKYTVIVYVTYNKKELTVHLNNGKKLILKMNTKQEIFYFAIKSENNYSITKTDIVAAIEGQDIKIDVPEMIDNEALIASFKFRGAGVKVGTKEQQSDVTENDFGNPLTYTLITESGDEINYTVTFTAKLLRIPRVYVETENGQPINEDKNIYINATIRVEDRDKLYTDGKPFIADTEIRGRGNSTWGMPKKPYRIKMRKSASLLGMSSDKSWALLANYSDKTLLRNITAFEISRMVDIDWTPGTVSVDLYFNGAYQGVYTLTEHVKVSEERVNLNLVGAGDNSGEAVTGDYFLELDFHYDEPYKFRTENKQLPIMFKDPEEPTTEQLDYVKGFFDRAEKSLYSDDFLDAEKGYRNYIDVKSFIKYYIVQELSKNVDGNFRGSCYLSLRRNGKIEVPLVWDFDIAFGNAEHIVSEQHASSAGPDGWYIKYAPWFERLFDDPQFVAELKNKWNEMKPQLDQLPQFVREHAEKLDAAQSRNFGFKNQGGAGWSITAPIWPSNVNRGSYNNEIIFLTNFIEQRLSWLDININNL